MIFVVTKLEVMKRYKVYVDVLFTVNFIMDYFALCIICRLLNRNIKTYRKVLSAFVGAGYTIAIVGGLFANPIIENVCTYIIIVLLMIRITLGKCKIQEFVKRIVIFYAVFFVMGGIANALYYNTVLGYILQERNCNWVLLLVMMIISKGLYALIKEYVRGYKIYANKIYEVTITWNGNDYVVKGLLDTGNNLWDMHYRKSVSVIEKGLLLRKSTDVTKLVDYKYHIIPFSSLGKKNGLIEVIEVPRMSIKKENQTIICENVLLGLYQGQLSATGRYNMLLNAVVFEKEGAHSDN